MAWEYKTIYIDPQLFDQINFLGKECWEAFAAAPVGGISNLWVVWLKRPNYESEGDPTPEEEAHFQAKRRGRHPKGE